MYENGLGIKNLEWLICHKTKLNLLAKITIYEIKIIINIDNAVS